MGVFRLARKGGLSMSRRKRSTYVPKTKRKSFNLTPGPSPFPKKIKVSATPSHKKQCLHCESPSDQLLVKVRSPWIKRKAIPFEMPSEILQDMGLCYETDSRESFNDDSNNESFEDIDTGGTAMTKTDTFNIDEAILKDMDCSEIPADDFKDKSEQCMAEQISKMLPAVIENFEANGKTEVLERFFRLVSEQKFPFKNIAFLLWCDLVNWFSTTDTRAMRYNQECLKFFWVGRKLFGGRFIRFMTGMKNEESILKGNLALDPCESRLNFACPNEAVLRGVKPVGNDMPLTQKPGMLESMIKFKAEKDDSMNSYVLMLDGKKIKKGTDVDLLGFEKGKTLKEREEERDLKLKSLDECIDVVAKAQEKRSLVFGTDDTDAILINDHLQNLVLIFSKLSQDLQELRVKKKFSLEKYKEMAGQEWRKSKYAFSIDLCMTSIWKIDNIVDKILGVIRNICKTGAHLNAVGHLFTDSDLIDIRKQQNVQLLREPENLSDDIDTSLIKQRSERWFKDRKCVKATGSTIYQAIGCDGLKRQKEHYDKVINKIEPPAPSEFQQQAMKHGCECEIHQIATMASVIMPFLYPELIFREEGYYYHHNILVSPDGSLRSTDAIVKYAFEGKAPVKKTYTRTIHSSVPERYMTQTMFEAAAVKAEETLYLSWSEKSCTLFKIPCSHNVCADIEQEVNCVYEGDTPKRPNRISTEAKKLKASLAECGKKNIFIGEFPSVKGYIGEENSASENGNKSPFMDCTRKKQVQCVFEFDELQRHLLQGKEIINETYEIQRIMASQVVVYLLGDTDRFWKEEQPHAVPVLYFYRGYSLSMEITREITEECKKVCRSHGLDVVACASDGEFSPIIVRGRAGNPLTQHQLAKDLWKDVCKFSKLTIINSMCEDTNEHEVKVNVSLDEKSRQLKKIRIVESTSNRLKEVQTPSMGWIDIKKSKGLQASQSTCVETECATEVENITEYDENIVEDEENENKETAEETEAGLDDTHIAQDISSRNQFNNAIQRDLCATLRVLNAKKFYQKSDAEILEQFESALTIKQLTVKELTEIAKCLNNRRSEREQLKVSGLKKHELVNLLSSIIGDDSKMEAPKNNRVRNPPSLKCLAQRVIMKRCYPKRVLNVAYCNFMWQIKKDKWKKNARVASEIYIHGVLEQFDPFYVPDESANGDFEVSVYDKTHLGSNLRKCLCLNRVHGISKKAWEKVSEEEPGVLNPTVIEINEESKIVDQMKERLARDMLSVDVEATMRKLGFNKEAHFCNIVRLGLYEADDKPGISAVDRCKYRLRLIEWLSNGVDFGDFPPYGSSIKGMSSILYEGLRTSNEAKLYLYCLVKKGKYNVRSANTLCSESFFSTMQEMDRWGQGILTSEGVQQHISDFTTITAMKMKDDRSFLMRTKASSAYPLQTMMSGREVDTGDSDGYQCSCRKNRFIKCIIPRDHFFDTQERARREKKERPFKFSTFNEPSKGDVPVRDMYKIREQKIFTSKRLGLRLDP